jgi:tryptophanyl-tRNA synthetase
MTQFKEKAHRQEQVRVSLLTCPVLMASDILLYDTQEVPVGEDQSQHVELARDVAIRSNHRYGPTFTLPKAVNPPVAARIMDLARPTGKMSKSASSAAGSLRLLDEPGVLRRKVMRAVTDADGEVAYDPECKPGVSNLLAILAACTGQEPAAVAGQFGRYGDLKQAVADAVAATLTRSAAAIWNCRVTPSTSARSCGPPRRGPASRPARRCARPRRRSACCPPEPARITSDGTGHARCQCCRHCLRQGDGAGHPTSTRSGAGSSSW